MKIKQSLVSIAIAEAKASHVVVKCDVENDNSKLDVYGIKNDGSLIVRTAGNQYIIYLSDGAIIAQGHQGQTRRVYNLNGNIDQLNDGVLKQLQGSNFVSVDSIPNTHVKLPVVNDIIEMYQKFVARVLSFADHNYLMINNAGYRMTATYIDTNTTAGTRYLRQAKKQEDGILVSCERAGVHFLLGPSLAKVIVTQDAVLEQAGDASNLAKHVVDGFEFVFKFNKDEAVVPGDVLVNINHYISNPILNAVLTAFVSRSNKDVQPEVKNDPSPT